MRSEDEIRKELNRLNNLVEHSVDIQNKRLNLGGEPYSETINAMIRVEKSARISILEWVLNEE